MNLKRLVKKAINTPPPVELLRLCGEYYEPYYHLMYLLSRQMTGKLFVELGVHVGRGLVAMSGNGNLIIGIDSYHHPDLDRMIMGHRNILFHRQASLPVSEKLARWVNDRNYKGISLLHIDTEHSYSMAKAEFEAYSAYLARGAYVLFDDLHAMDDDVMAYFDTLDYEKVSDDRLHPNCGYGVLIYE